MTPDCRPPFERVRQICAESDGRARTDIKPIVVNISIAGRTLESAALALEEAAACLREWNGKGERAGDVREQLKGGSMRERGAGWHFTYVMAATEAPAAVGAVAAGARP